jgi:hypothetical protein
MDSVLANLGFWKPFDKFSAFVQSVYFTSALVVPISLN